MAKNIVICCDGTGNEFNLSHNSNVVKLYSTLVLDGSQVGYYHPGVGTMGDPSALTWYEREWTRALGLAFGYGLFDDVGRAYGFLMEQYEHGDLVYVFGFSRGAYTARALAGLINMYGLLRPGNEPQVPYILRMYKLCWKDDANFNQHVDEARAYAQTFSRPCPVHFIGVWDTVSSVGWFTRPAALPYTGTNAIVTHGRHALSIDERRCFFRQNVWGPALRQGDHGCPVDQDIKQVWFAGVHSDIGGSYEEKESGLAKITLEWMLMQAMDQGLKVDRAKAERVLGKTDPQFAPPDPLACIHESLQGFWWQLAELLPHKHYDYTAKRYVWYWPRGRHRTILPQPCVHETVGLRINDKVNYKPGNLPKPGSVEPWRRF
jgi:uncharacterized protein (DUF2235 family)